MNLAPRRSVIILSLGTIGTVHERGLSAVAAVHFARTIQPPIEIANLSLVEIMVESSHFSFTPISKYFLLPAFLKRLKYLLDIHIHFKFYIFC